MITKGRYSKRLLKAKRRAEYLKTFRFDRLAYLVGILIAIILLVIGVIL